MGINDIYKDSMKNSIGKDKKGKISKKIKKIAVASFAVLISIASGVSLCSCTDPSAVNYINVTYSHDAASIYEKYNMDKYGSYTVEDYSKMPDINDDNLIGFYEFKGKEECNKIAQALGYDDLNDYLVKHDYVTADGRPSVSAWREYYADKISGKNYDNKVK